MELRRSFTGKYCAEDVDEFIREIKCDYEETLGEQRDRISSLRDENRQLLIIIEKYKVNENYIIDAITKAEEAADSIIKEAKQKAKMIIDSALREDEMMRRNFDLHCQRLIKLKRASEAIFRAISKTTDEQVGEDITFMKDNIRTMPFAPVPERVNQLL